jgi:DNA-binding CsgD family transcriptional regulator
MSSTAGLSNSGRDPPRFRVKIARPNRKIAEVLSISVKSVEMHRASALKKLNADSTAALIRYAIKNKLVEA